MGTILLGGKERTKARRGYPRRHRVTLKWWRENRGECAPKGRFWIKKLGHDEFHVPRFVDCGSNHFECLLSSIYTATTVDRMDSQQRLKVHRRWSDTQVTTTSTTRQLYQASDLNANWKTEVFQRLTVSRLVLASREARFADRTNYTVFRWRCVEKSALGNKALQCHGFVILWLVYGGCWRTSINQGLLNVLINARWIASTN